MVESSDPASTADKIIGAIKKGVDVIGMGVGINGLRKCKDGRVAISLESEREREAMGSAIEGLGDSFSVSEPRARDPCLRLPGVIADLTDAKVEEALLRQNESLLRHVPEKEQKVKVIRRVRGRNDVLNGVIVQVSPAVWGALRDRRVRVGYQMITVVDQSPLVQCYRCLGFGHRAGVCRATEPTCGRCAGAHDTRECAQREGKPCCVNCRERRPRARHDHPAYSADCPEWRRWDAIARLAVRYC